MKRKTARPYRIKENTNFLLKVPIDVGKAGHLGNYRLMTNMRAMPS